MDPLANMPSQCLAAHAQQLLGAKARDGACRSRTHKVRLCCRGRRSISLILRPLFQEQLHNFFLM